MSRSVTSNAIAAGVIKRTAKSKTRRTTAATKPDFYPRAIKSDAETSARAPTNSTANLIVKRKREDEHDNSRIGKIKKQCSGSKSATPAPYPSNRNATPAVKALATKKSRQKVTINQPPTERLDVYVFGTGSAGELGLGSGKGRAEVKRPRLNPLLDADKVGVVSLSVGGMHTAVLTHDNKILTWGGNDQGALGRNTTWGGGVRDIDEDKSDISSESDPDVDLNPFESTPGEIDTSSLSEDIVWTQLAATDSATFALTNEGLVYGWGTFRSNEGIMGFDVETKVQKRPTLIQGLQKITKLAAGANHVLALQNNGSVFAWGSGQQNQLGRRILERRKKSTLIPTRVSLPKNIVGVGAGSYHSFAIRDNGDVYSWGLNGFGETGIIDDIGDGGEADVHLPTVVESLRGKYKIVHIEGGAHHTVAVTIKGELLVWGRIDGFQLGIQLSSMPEEHVIKDTRRHPRILTVPTQVPNIKAAFASAGSDHCVAITTDGKAYAWGFSVTYQTGLGTLSDVEVAQKIDNTATREKVLVWAGCGGQFSVIAGLASKVTVNGVH